MKDLTGAATNVKMEDIPDLPGTSILDALSGQVVGLSVTQSDGRPGSTGSFKVRQPMSFDDAGNFNQPLIVIDDIVQVDENGEPSMTAFNMLNQSEIESMTVLKDASASIYGIRAANGVILVTSKHGGESSDGKFDITFSANYGWQQFLYMPETASAANHMLLINEKSYNDFGTNYPRRTSPKYTWQVVGSILIR